MHPFKNLNLIQQPHNPHHHFPPLPASEWIVSPDAALPAPILAVAAKYDGLVAKVRTAHVAGNTKI